MRKRKRRDKQVDHKLEATKEFIVHNYISDEDGRIVLPEPRKVQNSDGYLNKDMKHFEIEKTGEVTIYKSTDDKKGSVVPYVQQSSNGWQSPSNYGITYQTKNCHHYGNTLVFELDGKKLYGAKKEDIILYGADLIIDLVGIGTPAANKFVISSQSDPEFADLNNCIKMPKVLRLDWKDYTAPEGVPIWFWIEVWKRIPQGRTIVCCHGSHGRTGTCIASLMIANGYTADAAIAHVRKEHCKHAIETKSQEIYLGILETELAYGLNSKSNKDSDVRVSLPPATSE